MGVLVLLPLVAPVTAWPVARLAERHLHPRLGAQVLTATGAVLAACSTLCLVLLAIVGTAQLPGNPLPDGWSDPQVRQAVPHSALLGKASIIALSAVAMATYGAVRRHYQVRGAAQRALHGIRRTSVVVLPDAVPYAHTVPDVHGPIVVSTAMLAGLSSRERRALFAHERAHLRRRHHRYLLTVRLAARANPFLLPLRDAVTYCVERWADEEAAHAVGDRRLTARAVGRAALISTGPPAATWAAFAATGPVPRRVEALLAPPPLPRLWTRFSARFGLAAGSAVAGTALSALSSANSTITLLLILKAATPW
ncbi:M48 family metalloprotease [Streptomyces sp. NPDC059740]|uniref:M48 family metalloprotease n=1 Tax=Streptomyces sp. NPDC059740 TaxID=3346926 RepID=UPI00364A3844